MKLIHLTSSGSEVPVLLNIEAISAIRPNTINGGTNIYLVGQASLEHAAFHVSESINDLYALLSPEA